MLQQVIGKTIRPLPVAELRAMAERAATVWIDLGAGDGALVARHAAANPTTLCIGVDASADSLREVSGRAARPRGQPNAVFLVAAAEALPESLDGLADCITINFPWGSLLRACVEPVPAFARRLVALGKPSATVTMLLNASVFADAPYRERLHLPPLDESLVDTTLAPAYAAAGLIVVERRMVATPPYRTTWGQRLTRGSQRQTLLIVARIASSGGEDTPPTGMLAP
ncbi:MAG: class I SAM-dependent methyltransferase [Dehalococcoidia bacterium]|nr:class I SAM-dependent methyltransferase [Dehalococcoidia bacterium]